MYARCGDWTISSCSCVFTAVRYGFIVNFFYLFLVLAGTDPGTFSPFKATVFGWLCQANSPTYYEFNLDATIKESLLGYHILCRFDSSRFFLDVEWHMFTSGLSWLNTQ